MPRVYDRTARAKDDHNPLKNLLDFQDMSPYVEQAGETIRNSFASVIYELTGIDLSSWDAFIASLSDGVGIDLPNLSAILNQIVDIFNGLIVTPINAAIQGVKDWWVSVGDFFQDTWDSIWQGLTGGTATGKTTADVKTAHATVMNDTVNAWTGSGIASVSGSDSSTAQVNAQAVLASNAAAIAQLQNQANGDANSGKVGVVDFTSEADAASLPASFTQIYSGTVDVGSEGIAAGLATWLPSGTLAPVSTYRACVAIYNVSPTDSDYQRVGAAFSSTPTQSPFFGAFGHNRILCRSNLAGTSFVYVDLTYDSWEIGCVVAGVKTVWKTNTSAGVPFSFKAGSVYWIRPGTSGGPRIYQIIENNTVLWTHTEVGTASMLGAGYRYPGVYVRAERVSFGNSVAIPASMLAFAFSDNTPAAIVGSGFHQTRTDTATVSAAAGDNLFPDSFYDTANKITQDYISTPAAANKVTVALSGWYAVRIQAGFVGINQINGNTVTTLLYRNGSIEQRGDAQWGTSGSSVSGPSAGISGVFIVYLDAGDYVQPGYHADGAQSNAFNGEGSGVKTYWSIALLNRSIS